MAQRKRHRWKITYSLLLTDSATNCEYVANCAGRVELNMLSLSTSLFSVVADAAKVGSGPESLLLSVNTVVSCVKDVEMHGGSV